MIKINLIKVLLIILLLNPLGKVFAFDDIDEGFEAIKVAQQVLDNITLDAKKTNVFTFFAQYPKQEVQFVLKDWDSDTNMNVLMHKACKLNMYILPNGFVKPNWQNLKNEDRSPEQLLQYSRLILLHEFSHCEYVLTDKFYLNTSSTEKVSRLNRLLDVTKREDGREIITDLARLQMENFADILGVMMYLKIQGDNPATIKTVNMLLGERQISGATWIDKHEKYKLAYTINPYESAVSIEKVLKNRQAILGMSPEQLKLLALQWSSEQVLSVVQREEPHFRKNLPYDLDTALALEEFKNIIGN